MTGLGPAAARAQRRQRLATALVVAAMSAAGWEASAQTTPRKAAPRNALVYFHYPLDRLRVAGRFTVRIGLKEMGVAPAGVDRPLTGHHHLLIDVPPPDFDRPIPSDYNHVHLGNGQTEVVVTLPKGQHTLQLLLGDSTHTPHDPPVISKPITVYVR